jgi:hypothetical protein
MKYSYFSFLFLLLIAACKDNSAPAQSDATANIAKLDTVKDYSGLLDSIREPSIREMVMWVSMAI